MTYALAGVELNIRNAMENNEKEKIAWKPLKKEVVFSDPFGRSIEKTTFQLPNGKISDYYLRHVGSTVVVLAVTDDKKIILARQYRPGKDKIINELPGGIIKDGQTPEEAAKAELLEETGFVGTLHFLCPTLRDGYSDWVSYCFVAEHCTRVAPQNLDQEEFIEINLVSLEEFKVLVRSGQMTDIDAAMLGLDYLKWL